jgi:hypothetical protein
MTKKISRKLKMFKGRSHYSKTVIRSASILKASYHRIANKP